MNTILIIRLLRFLVLSLALFALPTQAIAQGGRPPARPRPASTQPVANKVQVEVMVVHASNAYTGVDPKLGPVMQHLRFVKFSGFKQLSKQKASLGKGQRHSFDVEGGRKLTMELIEKNSKEAKIRVQVFAPDRSKTLDMTLSIHRNKSMMVAGPRHDGGVLIFPLTASY